jgi:hypothetical protein
MVTERSVARRRILQSVVKSNDMKFEGEEQSPLPSSPDEVSRPQSRFLQTMTARVSIPRKSLIDLSLKLNTVNENTEKA